MLSMPNRNELSNTLFCALMSDRGYLLIQAFFLLGIYYDPNLLEHAFLVGPDTDFCNTCWDIVRYYQLHCITCSKNILPASFCVPPSRVPLTTHQNSIICVQPAQCMNIRLVHRSAALTEGPVTASWYAEF